LNDLLLAYGQIVAVMNPFTAVSNFLALTEGMDREALRSTLERALIVVFGLGVLFIFTGRLLLEFYHISLNALRFGGGVLLMYIAIDVLSGQPRSRAVEPGEVAVVPLATPMIVGPGTMTLLINLGAVEDLRVVTAAFLLSALTIAAALVSARAIRRALGISGVRAMARFMALIIAGVASEMMWSGVKGWLIEAGITAAS